MGYTYLFKNIKNEIIYVGHTKNIDSRMSTHFSINGHLPKECYTEVVEVLYAQLNSLNEARLYEIYYVSKFSPKYNSIFSNGGSISLSLPELEFDSIIPAQYLNLKETEILQQATQKVSEIVLEDFKSIQKHLEIISLFERGLDLDSFSKKTHISPADAQRIKGHNKMISHNIPAILNLAKKIEAQLNQAVLS